MLTLFHVEGNDGIFGATYEPTNDGPLTNSAAPTGAQRRIDDTNSLASLLLEVEGHFHWGHWLVPYLRVFHAAFDPIVYYYCYCWLYTMCQQTPSHADRSRRGARFPSCDRWSG